VTAGVAGVTGLSEPGYNGGDAEGVGALENKLVASRESRKGEVLTSFSLMGRVFTIYWGVEGNGRD